MKNPFSKLAAVNFGISVCMFLMLIAAELFKIKSIFGVITGVYWVVLDLVVLVVSLVTGIYLWRFAKKK